MYRPRIIPVLLLQDGVLVKSVAFQKHKYIGDPLNAVRLFNEMRADELIVLDISATSEGRVANKNIIKEIGEEANMPFSVGGGITHLNHIQELLSIGAERVVLGAIAAKSPPFVGEAAKEFGSSSISVCIDVKKKKFKNASVYLNNGKKNSGYTPEDFSTMMADAGAGELIIQSIDRDGTMMGYDIPLLEDLTKKLDIPIVALGGAGNLAHMKQLYKQCYVSGFAAGSMFIYYGSNKGVLINYPEKKEIIFGA